MRRGMWRPPRAADRSIGPLPGLVLAVVLCILVFWLPLLSWLGWL